MTDFGQLLGQAREAKGVSLAQAERATRIRRDYLEALEAHEFSRLPASTYARGIVRNYAAYLGLDPAEMLAGYEALTDTRPSSIEVIPATKPLDMSTHWAPNFAIIAFMVVMSLVVFTWMYSAYFQEADSLATGTVGVATVTPVSESILAAVATQPTVATQGGGVATVTPTATPTATATTEATATTPLAPTEAPAAAVVEATEPIVEDAPVEEFVEPTEEIVDDSGDDAATTGAHSFVIWVIAEVWVGVSVNGESVADAVQPAGAELIFEGDTLAVNSGNSAYVVVYVDGVEYSLGDSWDATFTYP
ncbi:MAG TPA: helix-turn-helix domain-containing protein [Thermomicrobiales bacterium]|nr:helix-turn-helix domain-containing protein [Thermomicrobiales bacterium]